MKWTGSHEEKSEGKFLVVHKYRTTKACGVLQNKVTRILTPPSDSDGCQINAMPPGDTKQETDWSQTRSWIDVKKESP